jgi:hypothetical protein
MDPIPPHLGIVVCTSACIDLISHFFFTSRPAGRRHESDLACDACGVLGVRVLDPLHSHSVALHCIGVLEYPVHSRSIELIRQIRRGSGWARVQLE